MNCEQPDKKLSPTCWRCGTETPHWLRVYPVPRTSNIVWCIHCFVEIHARFDDPDTEQPMTVEVDLEILIYVAFHELPKVESEFGGRYAPRLLREGWTLEGGDEPVPAKEIERLRHWWPQFMSQYESDLGS